MRAVGTSLLFIALFLSEKPMSRCLRDINGLYGSDDGLEEPESSRPRLPSRFEE